MLALGLLAASSRAEANEPAPDRFYRLDPRPPNQFSFRATTFGSFAGVELGYRRGLGRHLSFGVALEYVYPDSGYGQLQAFGHSAELIAWIARPWIGPYFAATITVGHNFLFSVPELDAVSVGGGLAMGWSWDLPFNFNVGVSAGLRRMVVVERDGPICTLRNRCVFTVEEFWPRFDLTFGYRF